MTAILPGTNEHTKLVASALELSETDRMKLRDVMTTDGWAVVARIAEHGRSQLALHCANSGRTDTWLERGIYRGFLMFCDVVTLQAAEVESPEAEDLDAAHDQDPNADAKGGYDLDT